MSLAVDVIAEPERAQVLLHPARLRLLGALEEPDSAAGLSRRLGLPRQRINYHLRELLGQRLLEVVEEKRKGSCVERIYQRTGKGYAISTAALGELGVAPDDVQDRFSSAYQIALASRAVRDLGELQVGAREAGQKLPTMALEVDVRFRDAAARHRFAEELTRTVAELVERHHDEQSKEGRAFRFYLGAYPKPK